MRMLVSIFASMRLSSNILYTVGNIAKFFGVSKKTAGTWCKTGKLPAFKIGKEWKIRVSDLKTLIDRKVQNRKETGNTPHLF